MIKTKNGKTQMKGTGSELCTDLTIIVRTLYEEFKVDYEEEFAKHLLTKSLELGLKTEEEIEQEMKEKVFGILKRVVNSMNEDLKGEKEHE